MTTENKPTAPLSADELDKLKGRATDEKAEGYMTMPMKIDVVLDLIAQARAALPLSSTSIESLSRASGEERGQQAPEASVEDARDAARYRRLRSHEASLETQQRDKGIVNGPSCYQEVEGIRELKWGAALDSAIDAAMSATQEGK